MNSACLNEIESLFNRIRSSSDKKSIVHLLPRRSVESLNDISSERPYTASEAADTAFPENCPVRTHKHISVHPEPFNVQITGNPVSSR